MEFYSPQPEHAQLHGSVELKDGLRMRDSGIDALLEELLIPSPPLSPVMSDREEEEDVQDEDSIQVRPSWSPGLTVRRERRSLQGFLAEYRAFRRQDCKSIRRPRMFADAERNYRTRRRLQEPRSESDDESNVARPTTPMRRRRVAVPSVASPLASAKAVHQTPNYVPSMSWEKLPDYTPSLDLLVSEKCLKVEWKGSPMDLSHDPLRDLLHPAELVLAQTLRLPCDLYLDSKRRLFLEKMHRFKQGLAFRRTDAQKACRIDVNKASRLYAAFEKVGWLKDSNFTIFL